MLHGTRLRKGRQMTKFAVEISDSALMHLCISGLESYNHEEGHRETFCLLWGNETNRRRGEIYYRVDNAFTDIDAERTEEGVNYNEQGLILKREIMQRCWPTQAFLGDYHTHPYGALGEVPTPPGASNADREDIEDHNLDLWLKVELKISLVLSITQLQRRGNAPPRRHQNRDHIVEWTLDGDYRLWLAAYVAVRGKDGLFLYPREANWPDTGEQNCVWLDIPAVLGSSNFNLEWK